NNNNNNNNNNKSGISSVTDNDEDMMDRTKKAMETLKEQRDEELSKKVDELSKEQGKVRYLSDVLFQTNESYYVLWLEKCKIALELFSKNADFEKTKERSKKAIRRYYAQLSQNDRLLKELKLLKQSIEVLKKQAQAAKGGGIAGGGAFAPYPGWSVSAKHIPAMTLPSVSSRANGIFLPASNTPKAKELKIEMNENENAPDNEKDSESDDDVDDLLRVENKFKTLVKQESMLQLNEEQNQFQSALEEMQNELSDMHSQLESKDAEIDKLKAEMLQQKERRLFELENEDEYYKHRANTLKQTCENLENNNVKLLQLLQNVENEFVSKLNYKPSILNNRNYAQEFDPKKCMADKASDSSVALLKMAQAGSSTPTSSANLAVDKPISTLDLTATRNDRKDKLKERLKSVNKSINGMEMIMDANATLQELSAEPDNDDLDGSSPHNDNLSAANVDEPQKPSKDWKQDRNVRQGKKLTRL
ncbi:viral A-type inclusion protein, partial [Reticulomyxa filosa]